MTFSRAAGLCALGAALLAACSSTPGPSSDSNAALANCALPGGPAPVDDAGADMHCAGQPPQPVSQLSCHALPEAGVDDGGTGDDGGSAPADDAGAPLPCGENSAAYGTTMFGTDGDDDDCKYHVAYSSTGICENENAYFTVTLTSAVNGSIVTGAATFAEICLNSSHIGPSSIDSRPPQGKQSVQETTPGTYRVGPIQFDRPGKWTVRFHFFETCYDTFDDSPHGHAAFFVDVP